MNKQKINEKTVNTLLCIPFVAIGFYISLSFITLIIYYGNDQKNISYNNIFNTLFNISIIIFAILEIIGLIVGLIYMIKNKKIKKLWFLNIVLIIIFLLISM